MGHGVVWSACGVLGVAAAGFGLSAVGASASPGFACSTDIGATPSGAGLTWSAQASCDRPMRSMVVTSEVLGSTGRLESTGNPSACTHCQGVATSGVVPVVIPGSLHTLVVEETEVAPAGEIWGALDSGPSGRCTGSGTATAHCVWMVSVEEPVPPLDTLGVQPSESAVANYGQQLLDETGV